MTDKKNSLTNQKIWRIVSAFALAVLLWFFVNGSSGDIIYKDIMNVPVNLMNADRLAEKNLVLSNAENYYVNLKVKGMEKTLSEISADKILATVDLSTIDSAGDYTPEVELSGLSNSVIVESITPSTIALKVEDVDNSERSVSVKTEGSPLGEDVVISTRCTQKVSITGGEEAVSEVSKLVATANVNGVSADEKVSAVVTPMDEDGNIVSGISCSPEQVDVDITIGKVKNVGITAPKTMGTVAEGYKLTGVTVAPDSKVVGAKEALFDSIKNLTMDTIDVTGAKTTFNREVELSLPGGAYFVGENNKTTVTVTIEPLVEKSFTVNRIETQNLSEGLSAAKIQDSSVIVRLKGVASELSRMNSDDIVVYMDLSGKSKGEYEVALQCSLPAEQIVSLSPSKTKVTIE